MQGDRNNEGVFLEFPEAFVPLTGLFHVFGKIPGQIKAAVVFELVNEFKGLFSTLKGGSSEFEVERNPLAIGAGEEFWKITIEDFSADLAKGLANPGKAFLAGRAERRAPGEPGFAKFANRRVDKIKNQVPHSSRGSVDLMR